MTTKKTSAAEAIKAEDVVATSYKITDSAREFVKRSAASAKEGAEKAHEGTEKLNSTVEAGMKRAVGGYVSIIGGFADATFANIDHALTTVEKLAAAETFNEAVKIQSDYVRDSASANMNRARDAANIMREAVVENTSMAREQMMKVWPYGSKAA